MQTALHTAINRHERLRLLQQGGTHFFWGVDARGRRIHLSLESEGNALLLSGRDIEDQPYRYPFTPEGLTGAMRTGRLLPGLFLTFLVVSFARGFRCFGGPWQIDYLPLMQAGLVNALNASGYRGEARICGAVPTANYAAGMVVAVASYGDEVNALGPVEILARGGLTLDDLDKIANMRVQDAICLGDKKGVTVGREGIAKYYGNRLLQMVF